MSRLMPVMQESKEFKGIKIQRCAGYCLTTDSQKKKKIVGNGLFITLSNSPCANYPNLFLFQCTKIMSISSQNL